jgi:ubiquitin-small subunit ribosomal protein S27Ae
MAAKPQANATAKKSAAYRVSNCYSVEGNKLVRKNPFSPKQGPGYFMANHKDRFTCGASGYMEKKASK